MPRRPQGPSPSVLTCSRRSVGILLCFHIPSWHGTEAPSHITVTQCLVPSGTAGSWLSPWILLVLRALLSSTENVRQPMDCVYWHCAGSVRCDFCCREPCTFLYQGFLHTWIRCFTHWTKYLLICSHHTLCNFREAPRPIQFEWPVLGTFLADCK